MKLWTNTTKPLKYFDIQLQKALNHSCTPACSSFLFLFFFLLDQLKWLFGRNLNIKFCSCFLYMLVCIKTFGRLLYSEETRVLTGWERYRCNLNWEAGRRHILFFGFVFFCISLCVCFFLFSGGLYVWEWWMRALCNLFYFIIPLLHQSCFKGKRDQSSFCFCFLLFTHIVYLYCCLSM